MLYPSSTPGEVSLLAFFSRSYLNTLTSTPRLPKLTSYNSGSQSANNNRFVNALEKHIDDYKKGKGYISSAITGDIRSINVKNNNILAGTDPSLLAQYQGYKTLLPYDERSRFVYGMNTSTDLLADITNILEQPVSPQIAAVIERYIKAS